MFDKLENLLQKWVSHEKTNLYIEALETLNDIGFVAAWSELSQMLEYSTDTPLSVLLDDIHTIIITGYGNVLRAHAISFEGTLADMILVVQGLLILQDYDDPDMILMLTDDITDPEMVFCNLLELVTQKPALDYTEGMQSVSVSLLKKIANSYRIGLESTVENTEAVHSVKRTAQLRAFMKANPQALVTEAVGLECRQPGIEIDYLLRDYKLNLGLLEPKAPDQAALELTGLALLSSIGDVEFSTKTKGLLERIYTDIDFITKADVAMDKYIIEVIRNG